MSRLIMLPQEADGKPLGPNSRVLFLRRKGRACCKSANVRQVFLKFILRFGIPFASPIPHLTTLLGPDRRVCRYESGLSPRERSHVRCSGGRLLAITNPFGASVQGSAHCIYSCARAVASGEPAESRRAVP